MLKVIFLGQCEHEQPELFQQCELEHEYEHGVPRHRQNVARVPALDPGKDDIFIPSSSDLICF